MNGSPEELLLSLSPSSTLLVLLRALYRLLLDYGVLWPDGSDQAFVFHKDQLVVLIECGQSEALVRDLPRLTDEGLIRPVLIDEVLDEDSDEGKVIRALLVERRGARVLPLAEAAAPWEPKFPEWWEAPLPFAMCARNQMHINRTTALMFGTDLERLSVAELPEKDEFIVDLEGRDPPCFLAFRRLEPDIFILEDCTGDLIEAQDISWWAGLGRAWVASIEKEGRTWRREEDALPEGFTGQAWPCEWEGRFLGWLCVEGPAASDGGEPRPDASHRISRKKLRKKSRARNLPPNSPPKQENEVQENEVLKAIGPQTMGLLSPGQVLDEPENENRSPEEEQPTAWRAGDQGRTP